MQKLDGPYHLQTLFLRCGQFLFLIIRCFEAVAGKAVISVLLFLYEYKPSLLVTTICIKCVPPFRSR